MNFFEQQHRARKRTSILVVYFIAAVIAIVLAVTTAIYLLLSFGGSGMTLAEWFGSEFFQFCAVVTLLVIAFGSQRKYWQLREGGAALATMLGAHEVTPDTQLSDEIRYRNIVEEMAIASGIPAPRTFIMMRESGINALVAGFRPTEAVVVITQGCLDHLDRDELQGVIAHEFSHIFNGDMRLNMRLMAILAGVTNIGRIGEFLLGSFSLRQRHHHRRRNEENGEGAAALLGIALIIIGYVGLFFGRLIKSAISRQREFLADASSVQFTRNPAGIAGALIRIRNGTSTYMDNRYAEDLSHMSFGAALHYNLQGLLATHPPVDERLKAIGPEWLVRARVRQRQTTDTQVRDFGADGSASFVGTSAQPAPASKPAPTAASDWVGTVTPAHMGYASSILAAIPKDIHAQAHQPEAACWLMYALAIQVSKSAPESLLQPLGLNSLESRMLLQLVTQVGELGTRLRLPLIDLAIPALKQLPDADRVVFLQRLNDLVVADRRMTLFEFALTRILADHLAPHAGRVTPVRFRRYSQVQADIQQVFSALVHATGSNGAAALELYRRYAGAMVDDGHPLLARADCRLQPLETALTRLRDLTPLLKAPLVSAMGDVVMADGKVQVAEAELLRAICTLLDCPMPPLQSAA